MALLLNCRTLGEGNTPPQRNPVLAPQAPALEANSIEGPSITLLAPLYIRSAIPGEVIQVKVQASHEKGVELVQMTANGRIVSSRALPANTSAAEIDLTWVVDETGAIKLQIIAFTGTVASAPVVLEVQVDGDILPRATEDGFTLCRARIVAPDVPMYGGPGTDFPIMGYPALDENLTILGQHSNETGEEWFKTRREDGSEVWILRRSGKITLSGSCDRIAFALRPTAQPTWAGVSSLRGGTREIGIHVAPNVPVDMQWIEKIGATWVKVYSDTDAQKFRSRNVLYRLDLSYPTEWQRFREFVYNRATYLVSIGVDAIEVHNEPNLQSEWGAPPDATQYTRLLREAYRQIKSAAPAIIVVSGGLAPTVNTPDGSAINDLDFLQVMLEQGAGNYFDALGYHPYGFDAPPEEAPAVNRYNFRRAEVIRQIMTQYRVNKPIWTTEFGWLRDPAEDGVSCPDNHPSIRDFDWLRLDGNTQADYILRAFQYASRWPWSGPLFLWNLNWSQLPESALDRCSHMRWFSLLRADGSPTPALQQLLR